MLRGFRALVLPAILAGCAVLNPGSEVPAPRAVQPHEYPVALIAHGVAAADGVVVGVVKKVENEWEYDVYCHFPTQFLGCKPQIAWRVEVDGPRGGEVWAFPPAGQWLPIAPGMGAIFLYAKEWITPVAKCERMGQFASSCFRTSGMQVRQVVDTLDILPLADTVVVDSLRRAHR